MLSTQEGHIQRPWAGCQKSGHESQYPHTSFSCLGNVLDNQGKYEETEAMHRQALKARGNVLGREHPDTVTSVGKLGLVLSRVGKYEEAEAMHQRALEDSEEVLIPTRSTVSVTLACA